MPELFIIKICFTVKVNSICGGGSNIRNLCHKFSSQGPALRILCLRVGSPKFQGPSSRVLGIRIPCPRILFPVSWVSQRPGSRVSGPDFRLCLETCISESNFEELFPLKVHSRRFENLPIRSCSCENNTLKISYSKY